jgi:hypothetical protein
MLASGSGGIFKIATNSDAWIARACSIANSADAMARWVDDAPEGSPPPVRCGTPKSPGVRPAATP